MGTRKNGRKTSLWRRLRRFVAAAAIAGSFGLGNLTPAHGYDLIVAENLIVDLIPEAHDIGSGTWFNLAGGSVGDFSFFGSPTFGPVGPESSPAFTLNGTTDYFQGGNAPAGLTGPNPTRTIEAWVYNPSIAGEETVVAWGKRGGPAGTNMAFNYGNHGAFGAVGHWGSPDIGWNDAGGAPDAGVWHHLVYTYDGTTTRVYADGTLANQEVLGAGAINTHPGTNITLGAQIEPNGTSVTPGLRGSLSLGRIRVHDGVLSDADVLNNFDEEKSLYQGAPPPPPMPEPLISGPVHRYEFTNDASDSVGGAHGTALGPITFVDGKAIFNNDGLPGANSNGQSPPGNPPGAYVDLPNGIISALGNNATFEWWGTWDGPSNSSWQRIFDFGTSDQGEDFSAGAPNSYYVFVTPRSGGNTTRFGFRRGADSVEQWVDGSPIVPGNEQQHVVAVWDGDASQARLYINGVLVGTQNLHIALSDIPDVNNWLGRAQWNDPMFDGTFNEFRIYDHALTLNQVLGNLEAGPDRVNTVIPEPITLSFMTVAGLAMIRRNRREVD